MKHFWLENLPGVGYRVVSIVLVLVVSVFGVQTRAADLSSYVLQAGAPVMIKSFVNPAAGCSWTGVGGQVFAANGLPQNGLVVRVFGTVDGRTINQTVTTGGSAQFGPGGFHLQLGDRPAAAAALRLRIEDSAGRLLSFSIYVPMTNSCNRNLTIINLVHRTFENLRYLPLIRK